MASHTDTLVIGGGIIGLSSAWYLLQAGRSVRLLEQAEIGHGASTGNCGLVCPSHIMPLTQPGTVRNALRWLGRADAPLRIRPTLNPATLAWFLRFARRCRAAEHTDIELARRALMEASLTGYGELRHDILPDIDWADEGVLYIFSDPEELEGFRLDCERLHDAYGMALEVLDGAALCRREPALRDGLAGAILLPGDSHLRPDRLLAAWSDALRAAGCLVHEHTGVSCFSADGTGVRVGTKTGETFTAGQAVVATGAWPVPLRPGLKRRLPIQPGAGHSITMSRPALCPRIPCLFHEPRVVATPWASGYRLGGTMDFGGHDARVHPGRLAAIRTAAAAYLRDPEGDNPDEPWCGWRPMTVDGIPYIGPLPEQTNVLVAAGHNMVGITMAPATGMLVAALATGSDCGIDPTPYRVERG